MKRKDMFLIYVDYEEYKPETYNGVGLRKNLGHDDVFRVNTGDFDDDYAVVLAKARELAKASKATIMNSSSVDNWCMDRDGDGEEGVGGNE